MLGQFLGHLCENYWMQVVQINVIKMINSGIFGKETISAASWSCVTVRFGFFSNTEQKCF